MGLFTFLKKAATSIASAAKSAVGQIAKLGKRIVGVVKEVGQFVSDQIKRGVSHLGRAVEDLGRCLQGKPSASVEGLQRQLNVLLHRVRESYESAGREIADFHEWARMNVLKDLLPTLVPEVSRAGALDDLAVDVRVLAQQGLLLVDDPTSASDEVLESVERLAEQRLGKTVDAIALERLVFLFEGLRQDTEKRCAQVSHDRVVASVRLREARLRVEIGVTVVDSTRVFENELRQAEELLNTLRSRLADRELVSWATEGLLRGETDVDAKRLYLDEIDVIREIVWGFYCAGDDAILSVQDRSRLRDAAIIFRADAAERIVRESVEVPIG